MAIARRAATTHPTATTNRRWSLADRVTPSKRWKQMNPARRQAVRMAVSLPAFAGVYEAMGGFDSPDLKLTPYLVSYLLSGWVADKAAGIGDRRAQFIQGGEDGTHRFLQDEIGTTLSMTRTLP